MLHPLLLSVLAAAQGGPVHAELHPANSDVYLELADVSVLLTELDKAPLLRFLRDERLAGLLTELGQPTNRPLKELAKEGLARALPQAGAAGWLDGLKTVSASAVAIGPGSDSSAPVALLAVLDLASAEQAGALRAVLIERATKHEPMEAALPGVERLHMGATAAADLWCVAVGSRLVVGGNESKVEDYVARADKKSAGLASSETFQKQVAALDKPSGTPLLWFALARSIQDIMKVIQEADDVGMNFLAQLPNDLNPLGGARLARMQFVGERFVTEMVSSDAASTPTSRPIDPAWLEPVPAGSMIVYSSAFDGAAAGKHMRELLAKSEQSAAAMSALEQKLGFGPERVLARLGPGLTVYAAPPAGIGLPETRIWIDCDDPAAFTSDCEALIGALGETLPGFLVKTKPYKVKKSGTEEKIEVPITTLTLPPDLVQIPMISLAPSFAPIGKKLVFGFSSMDVKNELKRVHAGDGEPIVAGANPLSAYGLQLPAEARAVFVMDWGKLFASIVGTVKAFAGMAGPEAMPFDLAKLPPPEMFGQYFKPTIHYTKNSAGGVYRRNEASFGPETWLGILAAVAANMAQQSSFDSAEQGGEIPPPEPAGDGQ